jgi:hypothetical protein
MRLENGLTAFDRIQLQTHRNSKALHNHAIRRTSKARGNRKYSSSLSFVATARSKRVILHRGLTETEANSRKENNQSEFIDNADHDCATEEQSVIIQIRNN